MGNQANTKSTYFRR